MRPGRVNRGRESEDTGFRRHPALRQSRKAPATFPARPFQLGDNTNGGNYRPLWAHSLDPMDMIVSGWFMSLFQALHPASMMAS